MEIYMHSIQINQPTRGNSFTSLLLDVCVWLNMFRAPLRPSSGYNLPDHNQQRSNRHSSTVKPEAPSAVVRSWWWAERRLKHVVPHTDVKE